MSTLLEERVARGAAFLDKVAPSWESKIDLGNLKINKQNACICGQVFENNPQYVTGYAYYENTLMSEGRDWLDSIGVSDTNYTSVNLGFDLSGLTLASGIFDAPDPRWQPLQEAWVAEIKSRFDESRLSA